MAISLVSGNDVSISFLESEGFEDAVRNAISIGGDSDTLAAITGSLAEGFYGVPDPIRQHALSILDDGLRSLALTFPEPRKPRP